MKVEIQQTLRTLGSARLPLSLYSVSIRGVPSDTAHAAVRQDLELVGRVGRLADGSVGFLYIGPRAVGERQRRILSDRITRDVRSAMRRWSFGRDTAPVQLRAVHRWSDELSDAEQLIDELLRLRPRVMDLVA